MTAPADGTEASGKHNWCLWLCGTLFALIPLKFGTPIIFDTDQQLPSDPLTWIFLQWPLS